MKILMKAKSATTVQTITRTKDFIYILEVEKYNSNTRQWIKHIKQFDLFGEALDAFDQWGNY